MSICIILRNDIFVVQIYGNIRIVCLIKFILQPFCHRLWKMCYQLANEAVVVTDGMLVVAACEREMTLFLWLNVVDIMNYYINLHKS